MSLLSTKTPSSSHCWVVSLSSCSYAVGFLGPNSDLYIYWYYYYLLVFIKYLLYIRGRHLIYAYIDNFYHILYSSLKLWVDIIISISQVEKLKLRKISKFSILSNHFVGRILPERYHFPQSLTLILHISNFVALLLGNSILSSLSKTFTKHSNDVLQK